MPHGRGGSWIWPATRWAIYVRDKFRCVHCGVKVYAGAVPMSARRRRDGDDRVAACIDHTSPGCPPEKCVTACWPCNSSAQRRQRVIEVSPLTAAHREKGRRLFAVYKRQRKRLAEARSAEGT